MEFTPAEINTLLDALQGAIDRFHPRYEDKEELKRLNKLKEFFGKI